jgi:hypothetical protein
MAERMQRFVFDCIRRPPGCLLKNCERAVGPGTFAQNPRCEERPAQVRIMSNKTARLSAYGATICRGTSSV